MSAPCEQRKNRAREYVGVILHESFKYAVHFDASECCFWLDKMQHTSFSCAIPKMVAKKNSSFTERTLRIWQHQLPPSPADRVGGCEFYTILRNDYQHYQLHSTHGLPLNRRCSWYMQSYQSWPWRSLCQIDANPCVIKMNNNNFEWRCSPPTFTLHFPGWNDNPR